MMVGYSLNHGASTYRLFNPKMNRTIMRRNVSWVDFKPKKLEVEFDLFEPGIGSLSTKHEARRGENDSLDNSTISTHVSAYTPTHTSNEDTKVTTLENRKATNKYDSDSSSSSAKLSKNGNNGLEI